jgi:hypothetical protein
MIQNIFENKKYNKLALKNSTKYKNAKLFPNIHIKNFLPIKIARNLYKNFPKYSDKNLWINFKNYSKNKNANNKKSCHDERKFSNIFKELFRAFNSRQFILFLETITDIPGLIPDPYFIGGGIHIVQNGGYLNTHTDFNWHHKLQAHRRVNVLIYLTPNWKKKYNGYLELSDKKKKITVSHAPTFNSVVIFNTNATSYHGHPVPLNCGPKIFRRVLNLYYYTTQRKKNEIYNPTFTNYGKIIKNKIDPKKFKIENSPFCNQILKDYKKLK